MRKRLDYLKCRRQQWEAVYEYVTKTDAATTLATIEEAYAKVPDATACRCAQGQGQGQTWWPTLHTTLIRWCKQAGGPHWYHMNIDVT